MLLVIRWGAKELKTIFMKKSTSIMLSAMFVAAIAMESCKETPKHQDKWLSGKSSKKDSTVNNQSYRHYGGMWYPVYGGRINPGLYEGHSHSSFSSGNVSPSRISTGSSSSSHSSSGFRSGGFGGSSHSSVGS